MVENYYEKQKKVIGELNMQHLWKASVLFGPNSAISKNMRTTLRDTLTSLKQDMTLFNTNICKNCSTLFTSVNSQVKYNPKKRLSKKVNRVLKKTWKQSSKADFKRASTSFLETTSTVNITCLSCCYVTKLPGTNYLDTMDQRKISSKKSGSKSKKKKSRINILRLNKELQKTRQNNTPSWKKEMSSSTTHTSLNSFLASL